MSFTQEQLAAIAKWTEALRSGKYQQTHARLRDQQGHCCLGVLAEVCGVPATPHSFSEYIPTGQYDENGMEVYKAVPKESGYTTFHFGDYASTEMVGADWFTKTTGFTLQFAKSLAERNDGNFDDGVWSFSRLADLIDERVALTENESPVECDVD